MFVYKLLVGCLLFCTVTGESCKTNADEAGECVKLLKCPSAIELIKQNIKPKMCDETAYIPIVCCPINDIVHKQPAKPFFTKVSSRNQQPLEPFVAEVNTNKKKTCVNDAGETGECLKLVKCPSAIILLRKNIKPKMCDENAYIPIVCCPASESNLQEEVPLPTTEGNL